MWNIGDLLEQREQNRIHYHFAESWQKSTKLRCEPHGFSFFTAVKISTIFRILTRKDQLHCQIIESINLEKEFLERYLKAGDEEDAAYTRLKELHTPED